MSSDHEERLELLRLAIATVPDFGVDGACRFCVLWEAIQGEYRDHDCDDYGYGEVER